MALYMWLCFAFDWLFIFVEALFIQMCVKTRYSSLLIVLIGSIIEKVFLAAEMLNPLSVVLNKMVTNALIKLCMACM